MRSLSARRRHVVVGFSSLMVALALSVCTAPSGAVVAKIGGHSYGITPLRGVNLRSLPAAKRALAPRRAAAAAPVPYDKAGQLASEGGPVMHSVTTHVIYWDPSGEFTPTTKGIVNKFFTDVAHDSGLASNVFAVAGQYTDATGHAAYSSTATTPLVDGEAFPTSGCTAPTSFDPGPYSECLEDSQLQAELKRFIAAEKLSVGPTQLYFLLLPHKVATCLPEEEEIEPGVKEQVCSTNFFCAYHSNIEGGTPEEEILYADIPFSLLDSGDAKDCQSDGNAEIQHPNGDTTGTDESTRYADVALKYTSHEYIEAATDPLGNAWHESSEPGQEIGDKCNFVGSGSEPGEDPNAFLPALGGSTSPTLYNQLINGDHFYLQSEWDNAAKACLMQPLELKAAAFIPSSTLLFVGSPVSFSGTAVDPYGGELDFSWNFGDGNTGTGASPSHTYTAPGVYTVSMTPKDALTGSTATAVSHTVSVAPIPLPPVVPTPAPPAQTTTTTTTTSTTATATASAVAPSSGFNSPTATLNATSGAITFTVPISNPGTFSWLITFQNGKFGVFAASNTKCKKGFVRLNGRCRPAKIVFAKGSRTVAAAGLVSFTIKPSVSALKALRNASRRKKGLPVTATFTFQSSRGGSPVSHTQSLTLKPKARPSRSGLSTR